MMYARVFESVIFRPVNWCCKSTGVCALGVTLCLFGLTFLILTPVYDTNDDPSMALVASGYGNVGGPDEHLLYSNVLIGIVLKRLYEVAPLVPWYGSYLLLIQFLVHWVLLYVLMLLNRNYLSILVYCLFYLVVGVYCLTHLQFTTTAFLAGMAGLSMILANMMLDAQRLHFGWLKWAGGLCLIVSSLIRFASLQLLVLASIPLIFVFVVQNHKTIKYLRYVMPALITVVTVLGCKYYDQAYYLQNEDWRNFVKYHATAAKLINYAQIPVTEQTKPLFDQVHWSPFDYWMLRNWIYLDSETYSFSRLQEFKKQTDKLSLRKYPQVMVYRVNMLKAAFTNPILIICYLGAIFFAGLNINRLWQRRLVKWLLIWSTLIMVILVSFLKLPERVFIGLCAFPFYFSIFLNLPLLTPELNPRELTSRFIFRTGILIMFLAACIVLWREVQRSDQFVKLNKQFKQDIQQLVQKWPDKVFLSVFTFPIEHFLPLDNQSEIQDLKYLYLTGRQGSPLFQQKMKAYGIKSPYTDLYETNRLYLIFHPKLNPVLKEYLKQHYAVDIELKSVYEGSNYRVYPVVLAEKSNQSSSVSVSSGKEE